MFSPGDSVLLNLAVSVGRACAICDMRAIDDMYSTMLVLPTLVRAVSFRAGREKRNCERMTVENARNAVKQGVLRDMKNDCKKKTVRKRVNLGGNFDEYKSAKAVFQLNPTYSPINTPVSII